MKLTLITIGLVIFAGMGIFTYNNFSRLIDRLCLEISNILNKGKK